MKIAVLTMMSRNAGGLFYSVRWLSKALAEQGGEPTILSPLDAFSNEDLPAWAPLPVELFRAYGPLQSSPKMRRRLARLAPDLVHVHGIWLDSQRAAWKYQKKSGVPVVVSPRGMLDPWALGNKAWKKKIVEKWFSREALDAATCIHALCRSEVESIRAYGLKNPIALLPNAVELPELGTPAPHKGRRRLLFLGRIHPKKGLRELLQAWSKTEGDWELLIAGWGDSSYEHGLKTMATELGVNESVSFLGPLYGEAKDAMLRQVDAFILPSFSEGLPMSVLEAWAYGLPVLMTDFCNLPEGFDVDAAIHIDPVSESIAVGLYRLFSLPDTDRESMAARGRVLVEEQFSWPRVAREMQQVYHWCQTGKNPPDCLIPAQ